MIEPRVITGPTVEPVTLEEAKNHLRVDSDTEDDLINGYIRSAREDVETACGIAIYPQTLEIVYDRFPACGRLRLPRATPLTSVESVKYTDSAGVEHTWDNSLYIVDTDSIPGAIAPAYGESYPSFTPQPVNAVRIRYEAGEDPPQRLGLIREIVLLLVGHSYQNREAVVVAERAALDLAELPLGVKSKLARLQLHAF